MSLRRDMRSMVHSVLANATFRTGNPNRITFRWGKSDLSSEAGFDEGKSVKDLQQMIVEYIHDGGPLSVHVIVDKKPNDPDIPLLLRFAHRLNCPTELYINGDQLEEASVQSLIQSGVDWIWLPIGGVSANVHLEATGVSIEQSTYVLHNLLLFREETHTKIGVLMPWSGHIPSESFAVRSWAEELGVDSIHVQASKHDGGISPDPIPQNNYLTKVSRFVNARINLPGLNALYSTSRSQQVVVNVPRKVD